ncbi:MAG: COX15/CtaA family protein [Lapillicoccus sp.]
MPASAVSSPGQPPSRTVIAAIRTPTRVVVQRWTVATLVANAVIILTGGLVRLTGSGLGCPTWPRCTPESFVPHRELGAHGVIEFSNRMLTYVLIAVVLATVVVVWRWVGSSRSLRWHVGLLAFGVPFQGVIGGISVLTDLNPWVVGLHLIFSMVLVAASTWLVLRVRASAASAAEMAAGTEAGAHDGRQRGLAVAAYVLTWAVVYLGTVVTGSGPHAGDANAPRNGLDPQLMSHVHAGAVYLLIAITIGYCLRTRGTRLLRAGVVLLVVELAQGAIGLVQYYTDLPVALVAAHLVGAALLVAASTRLLLASYASPATAPAPRQPRNRTDRTDRVAR